MDGTPRRRQVGRPAALLTTILLVLGSVALAGTAYADQSPTGRAHSAGAQSAGAQSGTRSHAQSQIPSATPASPANGLASGHPRHRTHAAATQGRSPVNLPRPNDFQAQADPDGSANGGVDQPGGTGGADPTSQDGNNGSGNDADCEDDNNGVGVPGHCKDRGGSPAEVTPDVPGAGDVAPERPALTSVGVLGPVPDNSSGGTSSSVSRGTSAPHAGVLPETGAAGGLAAIALAGVSALVLGGSLVRRRRTAS